MASVIDQAIVLRTWEFSETSQTVSLLCRARGLVRGLAKGAHREKSSFNGGFQPLTRGEIVLADKPAAELATLIEWDLRVVYKGVRSDLGAHRAGLYVVDLVHHSVLDSDPHPALFDAADGALSELDHTVNAPAVLARFQWALLGEIGYRPRIDLGEVRDRSTYRFRPEAGSIGEDSENDSGWRVRGETVRTLIGLDGGNTAADSRESFVRAGRLLSEYLRHVLGRDLPTRGLIYGSSPAHAGRSSDESKG